MAQTHVSEPSNYIVSQRMKTVYFACMFVGVIGFAVLYIRDPQRAWLSYVIPFFYFLSLALGGLFFTAIQHVTKAGWSVNIRRVPEAFTSYLPLAAVSALLLLIGASHLYEWFDSAKIAADHLLTHKSGYLNKTFFLIRLVLFFGLWIWFAKRMVGRSLAQDKSGDERITFDQVGTGIAFLLVFALSYSLFSVDILMSLEPHWFSTIFGVYCFAGLFQSTLAFMILSIIHLRKKGLLSGYVTDDHMHDLGKFLFAFTVFWAYIAFSQYMLIWYANLPEETFYIIDRVEKSWVWVSVFLLVGKFIVPFIALLPRWAKRSETQLTVVSLLILVMQYVDLYWIVYPSFYAGKITFSVGEIAVFAGFLGLFLFQVTGFLSKNKVVPVKDPRIEESLHHHVTY